MKRRLCIALAALFVTLSVLSVSALNTSVDAVTVLCNDSGLYLISCSGSQAAIERAAPDAMSAHLNLGYTICGVTGFRGEIDLLCNDEVNDQIIIYTYDLDHDILDNFIVYGTLLLNDTDFCRDKDYVYIEDSSSGDLRVYSESGRQVHTIRFGDTITDMLVGYDGSVLVCASDTVYTVTCGASTALSGSVRTPLSPVGSDYYISAYGDLYQLAGGAMNDRFSVDSDGDTAAACVSNGVLYCRYGSKIYGYSIGSGEKICAFDTGSSRSRILYADSDTIYAADPDAFDVLYIDTNEFTDLTTLADPPSSGGSGSVIGRTGDAAITSDSYFVDRDNCTISGILPGTTIAQFRANMVYDGYTVSFYRDSVEKKSGNVGTAMTAVFENDEYNYTFELSVIGDLTGEGNRNSRDLHLLMDYLTGAARFNGVYSLSADLNDDERIDVIDLAMMKRLV